MVSVRTTAPPTVLRGGKGVDVLARAATELRRGGTGTGTGNEDGEWGGAEGERERGTHHSSWVGVQFSPLQGCFKILSAREEAGQTGPSRRVDTDALSDEFRGAVGRIGCAAVLDCDSCVREEIQGESAADGDEGSGEARGITHSWPRRPPSSNLSATDPRQELSAPQQLQRDQGIPPLRLVRQVRSATYLSLTRISRRHLPVDLVLDAAHSNESRDDSRHADRLDARLDGTVQDRAGGRDLCSPACLGEHEC